jgi:hypothetical protein
MLVGKKDPIGEAGVGAIHESPLRMGMLAAKPFFPLNVAEKT